jgi:hypothetical protein
MQTVRLQRDDLETILKIVDQLNPANDVKLSWLPEKILNDY